MKIFILAAGEAERWGGKIKQLVLVRDKTVLDRMTSMLGSFDYTILTHHEEIIKRHKNHIYKPANRNKLVNTVLSSASLWEGEDKVCFLLGDVIFTKKAWNHIFVPIDKVGCQFYGSLSEHFAFWFTKDWYSRVKFYCRKIANSPRLGSSWELYRSMAKIPLDKGWTDQWFKTLILDKTDDIDTPADYESKISSHYFDDSAFDL